MKAAYQAPPSMGFSKEEYWSVVPLPSLVPKHTHTQMNIYSKIHVEYVLF